MKDQNGNLYIVDAFVAITILLLAIFMLNYVVIIPNPTYLDNANNFHDSGDIIEILAGNVYFGDRTFIGDISDVLKSGKNSQKSIATVSEMCKDKFKQLNLNNYKFIETNNLHSEVLASSGNFNNADNISSASASYGDYSYTLYVW